MIGTDFIAAIMVVVLRRALLIAGMAAVLGLITWALWS